MSSNLQKSIERQCKILQGGLISSLFILAEECTQAWLQREALAGVDRFIRMTRGKG